ncbi:hypothetical protein Tco_0115742 [Tanacetum coccineum]
MKKSREWLGITMDLSSKQPSAPQSSAWKTSNTREAPSSSSKQKSIGKSKLSKADLEGPAYKIDFVNPEGNQLVPNMGKPLPLGGPPGKIKSELEYDISAAYDITHWWFKRKEFYITRHSTPLDRGVVRSHMRILNVISLKTYERYGYTFLKEIVLRRSDYNKYKISEADFKNLHPNDFEDLYLLHLLGKLSHLSGADKLHLFNAVNMWIRNIVIRKHVEDLQLRIESYLMKLNLTQLDWDASDFLFKEDYTIVSKPRALDHMVKDFKLFRYKPTMESRIWFEDDRRRSKDFMKGYKVGKARSKSENKEIVPTDMELVVEQSQQGKIVTNRFTLIVLSALRHSDKENMQGLGEMLDQHRKGMHEQFSKILTSIGKTKTPTPNLDVPTFVIITRSGTSTCDPSYSTPLRPTTIDHAEGTVEKRGPMGEEPTVIQNEEKPQSPAFYHPSKSSSVPFTSQLKKQKIDDDDERRLFIFRQIHINLPFLEAMIHMPKGTKVLKDLLLHKEKLKKVASSVKLCEECSAVIQRRLPKKEGDPRSFRLPCLIGPLVVKNELDDIGTSINLMPHSLFL